MTTATTTTFQIRDIGTLAESGNRSPGLVQTEPGRCVDAVSLGRRETFRVRAGSVALYNRE